MLIRLGSDSDDDMRNLTRSPFDPFGQLDHRDASRADQLAVFGHTVRNGNAITEIGVRLTFTPDHALDVTGLDAARVYQHLAGSANGFVLVRGASTESNVLCGELNHGVEFFSVLWVTNHFLRRGILPGRASARLPGV